MLMVVAMASFLFVGCLGTTPPIDPDDPVDPVEPVAPSVTPVIESIAASGDLEKPIISLYSSAIQYMNKTEVKDGIVVSGYAPKYSEVNIYIGGVVVGTSTAYGGDEEFIVGVAKADLGVDGAKTLYATATEMGLAESVPSTKYAFTLDTVAPDLVSVTVVLDGIPQTALKGEILTANVDQETGAMTAILTENASLVGTTGEITITGPLGGGATDTKSYGTFIVSGSTVTITPYPGNEGTHWPGIFTFTVAAGTVKDVAENKNAKTNFKLLCVPIVLPPS